MKIASLVIILFLVKKIYAQDTLNVDLYSPTTKLSLILNANTFTLSKLIFQSDVTMGIVLHAGKFIFNADTLVLISDSNKTFRLLRETAEIYNPLDLDTVEKGQKFLAWTIRYKNGTMQNGGWTDKNEKEGVWSFYDSTGHIIHQKLYANGVLLNDDFKFKGSTGNNIMLR